MSRSKKTDEAMARARQAAAQMKPVAEQLKPLAQSTRQAAGRQLHKTRAWAAPQVERTGQVLQDKVAPKVSSMLSAAAERIEPDKPSRRRWAVPVAAALTAAASAVAAAFRLRGKQAAPSAWATGTDAMSSSSSDIGHAPADAAEQAGPPANRAPSA